MTLKIPPTWKSKLLWLIFRWDCTGKLGGKSYDYWIRTIEANLEEGIVWYRNLPGEWWWGSSSDQVMIDLNRCKVISYPGIEPSKFFWMIDLCFAWVNSYTQLSGDCVGSDIDSADTVFNVNECLVWCDNLSDCVGISINLNLNVCFAKSELCDQPAGDCDATSQFCAYNRGIHLNNRIGFTSKRERFSKVGEWF